AAASCGARERTTSTSSERSPAEWCAACAAAPTSGTQTEAFPAAMPHTSISKMGHWPPRSIAATTTLTPGSLCNGGFRLISQTTPRRGAKGEDGRDGRVNTFYDAIVRDRPLPADGAWGMATLEVLLAIEKSGRTRKEASLRHQVPTID